MSSRAGALAAVVPRPSVVVDRAAWDAEVAACSGHLLQSWRWGEFKARHGWRVERLRVETNGGVGLAQVLFRHRGPISLGYLPRGPVLSDPDPALARHLFAAIDQASRRHRALSLIIEPETELPLPECAPDRRFVRLPDHIQPARTVKVPLLADEALLQQMHQKTRYNVRLAQRRGVTAAPASPTPETLETFYGLLQDTADRNAFGIHTAAYYQDFLEIFGEDAFLHFATIDDVPVAGLIAARFGAEAIYMYGASSTQHRANAAGFYLQFEAMRRAREAGCTRYDLWGIPATDPPSLASEGDDRIPTTRGDDWRGLYEFKVRFGGEIIAYPPARERRYLPLLATLARRFYRPGG